MDGGDARAASVQRHEHIESLGTTDFADDDEKGETANTGRLPLDRRASFLPPRAREAALQGLFIGDHGQSVLELYRTSDNAKEKGELLETLVIMDSDLAMEVIDQALAGDQ